MKDRIELTDNTLSMVVKMSEGDPGAITAIAAMLKFGPDIDPDAAAPELAVMTLDMHRIYGSRIWRMYKDVCGQSVTNMLGVLRAVQLGVVAPSHLTRAIDGEAQYPGWLNDVLSKVRAELPNFGR